MRPYRPKSDGRGGPPAGLKYVQPGPGAPRPDPVAGRFGSIRQAAEAVGWSCDAIRSAIERSPSLVIRATWPGAMRPVYLVDLDRLERAIGGQHRTTIARGGMSIAR